MRSWKEMVTCPYKPEHQVSIDRIQKHLVKCSKEHNDSQFEVCLLNASHHIPQQEMASHLRTCPHRKAVEIEFIKGWPVHGKEGSLERGHLSESHEDWESEAGVFLPYNPQQMAMKKQVIRQPSRGAIRSDRNKFIAAERKRHADLALEKKVAKEFRRVADVLEEKGEALVGDQ